MDARLANTWRLTVNEKNFIKTALLSEIRIDGRKPFEFRNIIINFGRQVQSTFIYKYTESKVQGTWMDF